MQERFSFKELEEFSRFLNQEYGLNFKPEKFQQLENRLMPLLRKYNCRILTDIILQSKTNIKLRTELLNELTTNETWFFRHENHHKILVNHILPEIISRAKKTGDNRLKIWSAGCSIGAELFSVLLTLYENLPEFEKWNLTLIGSDISDDAIQRAWQGVYSAHELRKLSQPKLKKYFRPYKNETFQINPEFIKLARFEVLNLLESWPARKFDVIFCCNVMIYFDEDKKKKVTERLLRSLNPQGYYFTSANESIHWTTDLGLNRLFIENEYVYQKSQQKSTFRLYQFVTPSDLLRALNLLNQSSLPYELAKINQTHSLAPKRAIYIDQKDAERAEELFSLSSIKIAGSKPHIK
jgi:chemotaxis protein methyltransferase CheR